MKNDDGDIVVCSEDRTKAIQDCSPGTSGER